MNFLSRLTFAVLLSIAAAAHPVRAQDASLYSGETAVANQEEAERTRALGPALINALIKLSGDASLATDPAALKVVDQAEALLQSTSYRQELEPGPGGTPVARTLLVALFKPEGLERLLLGMGRPVWSGARPATLALILIDDGVNKRLASAAQVAALGALTRQARDRGITLVFPTMDADDLAVLDPQMLWGGPPSSALGGLTRYRTPTALIVRLSRSGSGWSSRNSWVGNAMAAQEWSSNAADSAGVLVEAAAGLADRLAERYSIPANERKTADYRVAVSDVGSAADYGRVLEYLGRTGFVRAVAPLGASGTTLELKLTLDLSLDRFARMLAYDAVLTPSEEANPAGIDASLRLAK